MLVVDEIMIQSFPCIPRAFLYRDGALAGEVRCYRPGHGLGDVVTMVQIFSRGHGTVSFIVKLKR